jgi:hypothetical protein
MIINQKYQIYKMLRAGIGYRSASLEEFEDTKGVIRIRKSKEERQHNDNKKQNNMANNDLQNTTQKTKERATRTPLQTEGTHELCKACSSCSTSGICVVAPVMNLGDKS